MPELPTGPGREVVEQVRSKQRSHSAPVAIDSPRQRYLCFTLNNEWYGLSVCHLVEVLPPPTITRVPRVPKHILGVMNLRGEVLTAIDLKRILGLPQPTPPSDPALIVVEQGEVRTGLLVDRIGDLVTLVQDDFIEAPLPAEKSHPDLFVGKARRGDLLLGIIAVEKLLQSAGGSSI